MWRNVRTLNFPIFQFSSFSILLAAALLFFGCVAQPERATPVPQREAVPTRSATDTREPWQKTWDATVAAARQEGEVLAYITAGAETQRLLNDALTSRFGIQFNSVIMQRGSEVTERITREASAGLYIVDMIMPGTTTMVSAVKPTGLLAPIEPLLILPETMDPKAWHGGRPFLDKDTMIAPLAGAFNRYVLRNTDMVKPDEIKDFFDLLNPKWKGKMIINDPTSAGAGNSWVSLLVRNYGMDKTRDYLHQFVKQEPVITRDGRVQVEAVVHRKYLLGIAPRVQITADFIALKAPIALVKTVEGGNIAGSVGLAVARRPGHPNAARVITNWLLTKEGMQTFMKAYGAPVVRRDLDFSGINPIYMADPDEQVVLDDEESLREKGTVLLQLAKEAFAPIMR